MLQHAVAVGLQSLPGCQDGPVGPSSRTWCHEDPFALRHLSWQQMSVILEAFTHSSLQSEFASQGSCQHMSTML